VATLADLREGDRYLQINPYFHTFGLKAGLIASFLRGATMLPLAVFDIDAIVNLIERERVTMLPGPPTMYHSLLAVADKTQAVDVAGRCHRRRRHPGRTGPPHLRRVALHQLDDRLRL
jgi:acyl-CoA synthetase (AMP-forming)/AMP-acid ligase II